MKLKIHSPIIAAIAGVLFSVGAVQGDDKAKGKETKPAPAQAIPSEALKALEDLGLDPEMVKKMKKMMEEGSAGSISVSTTVVGPDGKVISQSHEEGGKGGSNSSSASVSSIVIGPDGKVISQNNKNGVTIDLGKIISEATAKAEKAMADSKASSKETSEASSKTSVSSSISGKVVIVGEDGEVKTHSLGDETGSDAMQKALSEAFKSMELKIMDPADMKSGMQVFGFGSPTIEEGGVSDRLDEIEKELKEQRKLLEKILKKL